MKLWLFWNNLNRRRRKLKTYKRMLQEIESQIWKREFDKHGLMEVRNGIREQYDFLRERVEDSIRRKIALKWRIIYAEGNEEVTMKDVPIPPREIEKLPDKPTKPHRFYKKERTYNNDKEAKEAVESINQLERAIERREPDVEQQKKQLEGIEIKVSEIDGAVSGLFELKRDLISMMKRL